MRALGVGLAVLLAGCQTSNLPPSIPPDTNFAPTPEIAEHIKNNPLSVKQETFKLRLPSGEVVDM